MEQCLFYILGKVTNREKVTDVYDQLKIKGENINLYEMFKEEKA